MHIYSRYTPAPVHMGLKFIICMLSTTSENNTKNIQSPKHFQKSYMFLFLLCFNLELPVSSCHI